MTPSKLAIVGTRGHYGDVIRDVAKTPESHIVAVAPGDAGDDDVGPILTTDRAHGLPEPRIFDDYRKMLAAAAAPDAVRICGPLELHAAMSITAIERDVHVLTEKPASVSVDYCRPESAPTHGDDWAGAVGTKGVMEVRPDRLHLASSAMLRFESAHAAR